MPRRKSATDDPKDNDYMPDSPATINKRATMRPVQSVAHSNAPERASAAPSRNVPDSPQQQRSSHQKQHGSLKEKLRMKNEECNELQDRNYELERYLTEISTNEKCYVVEDAEIRNQLEAVFDMCQTWAIDNTAKNRLDDLSQDVYEEVLRRARGSSKRYSQCFLKSGCDAKMLSYNGGISILVEALLSHLVVTEIICRPFSSFSTKEYDHRGLTFEEMANHFFDVLRKYSPHDAKQLKPLCMRALYSTPTNGFGNVHNTISANSKCNESLLISAEHREYFLYNLQRRFSGPLEQLLKPQCFENGRDSYEDVLAICSKAARLSQIIATQKVEIKVWYNRANHLQAKPLAGFGHMEPHCSMKYRPDDPLLDTMLCDLFVRPAILAEDIDSSTGRLKVWGKTLGIWLPPARPKQIAPAPLDNTLSITQPSSNSALSKKHLARQATASASEKSGDLLPGIVEAAKDVANVTTPKIPNGLIVNAGRKLNPGPPKPACSPPTVAKSATKKQQLEDVKGNRLSKDKPRPDQTQPIAPAQHVSVSRKCKQTSESNVVDLTGDSPCVDSHATQKKPALVHPKVQADNGEISRKRSADAMLSSSKVKSSSSPSTQARSGSIAAAYDAAQETSQAKRAKNTTKAPCKPQKQKSAEPKIKKESDT